MRLVYVDLIALVLIASNAIIWAQEIRKDLRHDAASERDKRSIDFGLFVRNLLLKSAAASNVKADLTRKVVNLKTTTSAPRRRTTTPTAAPLIFKFPFDLSAPINNKFNNGGYINFDYNDYGSQQPLRLGRKRRPTTTTTTTTATPPPSAAPTRRTPIPRRPYGLLGKQKLPHFDYYNDYDYNYDDADSTATSTTAPLPNPPKNRPIGNRARARGRIPQLRNRLIYEYRQPDDTSTSNDAVQTADDRGSQTPNNSNSSNNDETSTNTNDYTDDVVYDDTVNVADNDNPNKSSDIANPNLNVNSNTNFDPSSPPPVALAKFNNNVPPSPGRFGVEGYFNGPPGFGNFAHSDGFQYSPHYDFNQQYQQPSSPAGYSIRYY